MKYGLKVLVGLTALLTIGVSARAATPTLIEDADGKRLLTLDDPTVSATYHQVSVEGSGKASLYIHENQLLKNPADPAVLVVDALDVRHSQAGVKLAVFDGDNIRHGDRIDGKVVVNYQHPDIRPDRDSKKMYHVTGPALTHQELVAVLYVLKPELFTLTEAETAAQQKAIADAGAESDREAAKDHVAMKWTVLNGHGPVEKINSGTIEFAAGKGGVYPVTFDYTKDGGPTFTGVAASKKISGDDFIWAAYGTPKTVGLCVYKIEGNKLSGRWHPWYDQGDPKNIGTEELKGPETLDGDYDIVSAKAPATGAAYTGKVTIKPLTIVGAVDDEKPYSVTWNIGGTKIEGIAIRTGDYLYVATGGADVMIAKFKVDNGSFNGDFYKLGSTEQGGLAATN